MITRKREKTGLKKKLLWGVLGLSLLATQIIASQETLSYLMHPPGARPSSMGYAYTAISDDNFALYTNPAGLIQIKNPEWTVSQFESLETNFMATDYSYPFKEFTVSVAYFGAQLSGIEETVLKDNQLSRTGNSFSYQGNAILFGIAIPVWEGYFKKHFPDSRMSLGLSWSLIHEKIAKTQVIGSGMNGGFLWESFFQETPYRIGLQITDIAPPTLRWDSNDSVVERKPMSASFGVSSYLLEGKLLWAIAGHHHQKQVPCLSLGLEYELNDSIITETLGNDGLRIRAGLFNRDLSLGLGLGLDDFTLDYSLTLPDPSLKAALDPLSKISITLDIDKIRPPKPPPPPPPPTPEATISIEEEDNIEGLIGLYRSNIGIFKDKEAALEAAKKLKKNGISSKVIKVMRTDTSAGYKVVTEAFETPEDADPHLKKLADLGFKQFLRQIKDNKTPNFPEESSDTKLIEGPPSPPSFEVNIGVYQKEVLARRTILRLQENGIYPYITKVLKNEKVIGYKVVTGYFKTKKETEFHINQLKVLGYKQFQKQLRPEQLPIKNTDESIDKESGTK